MIDMVAISIFFQSKVVNETPVQNFIDEHMLMREYGISMDGQVYWEDGKAVHQRLHHKFESIPSHNATLAFKIVNGTDFRNYPYLKIVGNPAKLLQGHNVYGSDNIEMCVMAVVDCFALAYPELSEVLDWFSAVIDYFDITYTAHCENDQQARQVMDILKNVKNRQTKPSYCPYEETTYWNKGSECRVLKAYLKSIEVQKQIEEATKRLARLHPNQQKTSHLARQIQEMTRPEVLKFADGAVRFEARVFAGWMKEKGVHCSLALITDPELQKKDPDLIPRLWRLAFKDVFASFEGATMNAYDTSEVHDNLRAAYFRTTNKGNISYSKADRLFVLYRAIVNDGFEQTKARFPRNTWSRILKDLTDAGLSLAQLQNLNGLTSNVVPLIQMITVNFDQQHPAGYVEPKPMRQQILQHTALALAS